MESSCKADNNSNKDYDSVDGSDDDEDDYNDDANNV